MMGEEKLAMTHPRGADDADHTTEEATTSADRSSWTTGAPSAVTRAKTSPVAVFALVFGLAAFIFALTGVLSPLAILFAIVGIVLGVMGRKKGLQPQLTGKGVATGGLVLAVIALLLGIIVIVGAVMGLIGPSLLGPVQQQFSNLIG
ncbi:hypothetical protein E1161_07330 [Saccharopolyspora aridisoli]|uniref:DUF4190 domain-containing protein n=1 Tax=Saccharopolyspora aridisoli TaxID=2530385 RepID=A0A4R4UQ45_9PSEU|nr:hypothetical protein [Saccharopolyspora aridisoli]TDC94357.1 hypothetical protein E1161_07330 [Saccharopolyspora aridisoli]